MALVVNFSQYKIATLIFKNRNGVITITIFFNAPSLVKLEIDFIQQRQSFSAIIAPIKVLFCYFQINFLDIPDGFQISMVYCMGTLSRLKCDERSKPR